MLALIFSKYADKSPLFLLTYKAKQNKDYSFHLCLLTFYEWWIYFLALFCILVE